MFLKADSPFPSVSRVSLCHYTSCAFLVGSSAHRSRLLDFGGSVGSLATSDQGLASSAAAEAMTTLRRMPSSSGPGVAAIKSPRCSWML
eukprot:3703808-Prorocentrum_lima.AAC.1